MTKLGYVLAPKQLVNQKMVVNFMYREYPDNSQDSGWRFFSGTESDEYVNNPENIGIYDISTILKIDPSVKPYLSSQFGCAFERSESGKNFVPVDMDFEDSLLEQ